MKTLDAMKEIYKNTSKEFECKHIGKIYILKYHELLNEIKANAKDETCNLELNNLDVLKFDWKEVKKPVDFMAVVKSRKKVKVEHELLEEEQEEYLSLDILMFNLSNMHYEPDFTDIILNGKWYIED
ncbi:hypothetical protein [Senegalia massiliensis]|uniref:Uncharacterized protein n=1 Tax=Senegalia massiliensis TaxID=1720316 RepID=A0A845R2N5_9CLOT|nr:hypothetical protein [Senegalia massiliensis]NBI08219.1 hypothetical protein [Senegalia massiliensis]